jgi:hypothetical protein
MQFTFQEDFMLVKSNTGLFVSIFLTTFVTRLQVFCCYWDDHKCMFDFVLSPSIDKKFKESFKES